MKIESLEKYVHGVNHMYVEETSVRARFQISRNT